MTSDDRELLQRFHRELVRAIRGTNPEQLTAPFTVAEIYQNLVPYRTHRDRLGVEMNADYEHALLRLLAGEGDLLSIESRTARQEIRDELDSPNPNTGLYRDFAAADVRLNPEKIQEALEGASGMVEEGAGSTGAPEQAPISGGPAEGETPRDPGLYLYEDPEEEVGETGGMPEPVPEESTEDVSGIPEPLEASGDMGMKAVGSDSASASEEEDSVAGEDVPERCPWCRENLPDRPNIQFCPYCGSNVKMVPCPECGEELELGWRFCIACGTEVAS
jgi:hypothetical protein